MKQAICGLLAVVAAAALLIFSLDEGVPQPATSTPSKKPPSREAPRPEQPDPDAERIEVARGIVAQVQFAIRGFEQNFGDYPPSRVGTLKRFRSGDGSRPFSVWSQHAGSLDEGTRCLIRALDMRIDGRPPMNWGSAGNDRSPTGAGSKLDSNTTGALAIDPWENPYVYIHNRDYEHEFTYRFLGVNGPRDMVVRGQRAEDRSAFRCAARYQFFSAGPDGQPGTADDIGNW